MRSIRTCEDHGKSILDRGNGKGKSPEAGTCWVCFIKRKKARTATLEWKRRGVVGEIGSIITLGCVGLCMELKFYAKGNAKSFVENDIKS